MIRLTYLVRARPGMDRDAFTRYWLEEHGPLVASVAATLKMQRYVQVHTLWDDEAQAAHEAMSAARGGVEPCYDGVAEVYWSSRDDLLAALDSPAGQAAAAMLVEDERVFIDLPNSPLWLGYEYPQVNPTPETLVASPRGDLVKLYFPLRMETSLEAPYAHNYWKHQHGPIIREQAAGSGILRYIQVHSARDELDAALQGARGTRVPAYDGHAELWFRRSEMGLATPERRAAARRAVEDESRFIDFPRSTLWLAKEHVFVDRR
ncbi:MAG: EthD domain-containing protein [Pseudomonadota bacterium]